MTHMLRSPRLQPEERQALTNELLEQQFQFRQNMALLHGLPMPLRSERVTRPEPVDDPAIAAVDRMTGAVSDVAAGNTATAAAITDAADKLMTKVAPNTPATPVPGNLRSNLTKAGIVAALLAGGAGLPAAGTAISNWWNKPDVPAVTPADTNGNILLELERRGLSVAPTDLGEDIKRAFELNPQLREQLIQDVRRTLEANDVKSNR